MADPITFSSQTARFGLPYLFAGQAQKEFFINETAARIDSLMHPVVEGIANAVPEAPEPGACWIVGSEPVSEWAGHAREIACYQLQTWLFAKPSEGMRVFNRASGADMRYKDGWHRAANIVLPEGGATADVEARAAIAQLIEALVAAQILPQSAAG